MGRLVRRDGTGSVEAIKRSKETGTEDLSSGVVVASGNAGRLVTTGGGRTAPQRLKTISQQEAQRQKQIQQARVDLLDQALERQRRQDLSSGTIRNPADFAGGSATVKRRETGPRSGSFGGSGQGQRSDAGFTGERVSGQPDFWGRVGGTAAGAASGWLGDMLSAVGLGIQKNAARPDPAEMIRAATGNNSDMLRAAEEYHNQQTQRLNQFGENFRELGRGVKTYGEERLDEAKTGLGALGRTAVDLGAAATQMGMDTIAGVGNMLGPMLVRSFGSSAEEAHQEGADIDQQFRYGMGSAAISAATEQISNVAFSGLKLIKPGITDDFLENGISKMAEKLAKTSSGQTALKVIGNLAVSFGGEGTEEILEDLLSPYMKRLTYDEDAQSVFQDPTQLGDYLYDGLIGGLMGLVGGSTEMTLNTIRNRSTARRAQEGAQAAQEDGVPVTQGTVQEAARGQESTKHDKATARADSRAVVEKLRENIQLIGSMEPVSRLTGEEFQKSGGKLTDQVGAFFRRLGNRVTRRNFGDVILDERSIKNDIAHGIGRAKAITFAAVPDVIANGQQIDYQENWKGRGKDSYIFAAPVVFGNQRGFVAAVVIQGDDNRFYLHEVIGPDGELIYIKKDAPETVKTGISARGGDTGGSEASSDITIPQESGGVNAPAAAMENEMAGAAPDGRASPSGTFDTVAAPAAPSVAQEGGTVNAADGSVGFVNRSRRELSAGQTRELERLARAAGTRIAMVDREGTFQQGWYQDGQVLVSAEAEDPYREVVKHELTHLMQETAPAEYQAYRDFVQEIYQERGTLEENLGRLRELYLANQVELTEEQAMDELAADFAGELTEDERTIRRLAGERPSLARRFLETLRDLIGRLRSALGRRTGTGEADREVAALEQAARLWENALAETGRVRAGEEQSGGGTAAQDAFSREIERQWMGEDLDSGAAGYDGGTEYIGQDGGIGSGAGETDRAGDTGDRPAGAEGEGRDGRRYSVKGTREAQREIERLRRQNERLRQEMRRTGIPKANRQAVERQARAVLEQYGSQYDEERLANRLDALYEDMAARGGTPWQQQNAPTWEEIREQAREIARDVLAESRAEEGSDYYRGYDDALRELRSRAVSLDESYRGALDSYGGYQSFLQRSYGRLRLQDGGTPVDVVYDELSQRWPELFPEDIGGPADQLIRMEEVAESLETVENNPFAGNMDRAVEYAAGDILERFYETPQEKPTFADRQERRAQERLREQRQRDREAKKSALDREKARHQETVRKVRERYQEANKRLREQHREADRRLRDRQAVTKLRDTIARHAATLSRKLLRPTDTQHIPEHLRGSVLALLESLDLESGFAYEFTRGGTFQKVKPYSDPHLWQTKRTQAAMALREAYQELRESGELNTVVDPDLADNLEAVAQMGGVRLAEMDREQLEIVWRTIRAVEHSITKADKMLADSRFQTISEAAKALLEDNGGKARAQLRGAAGGLDGLFNLDMLTPETFLHKLGRAGDDLYRQMRQAQDKQIQILDEAVETTRKALADSGLKPYRLEREKRTFTLESGEKVTLTTAQVMELYNLTKRQQAQKHLYTGGIRPEAVARGLRMESRGGSAYVTEADVAAMVETLTPEQKALADKLRAYLSSDLSAHGNEATMAAYGYEKFKERDYWPIKVDRNTTRDDPAAEARSKTIPGYGMTKAVNPKASNPVTLHSVFDTYTQHVTEMAAYAAWLGVSEDATRLQNYRYNKGTTPTAKDMIQRAHGEGGNAYLQKLLGDIAQGTKARRDTVFSAGGLTSAFKASSVGGNLRVFLQQPTSILRAAEMIDMKYLAAGMARRGGWKKALEHAPIAKWKDWGYFEMDTGKSLKELMLGQDSRLEKVKSGSMAPAGWADSAAWGALWNAVELETQAKRPDLERGSPEFYEAANRRFGEIVDRTQVVDTVLHRSQIMRSENAANKMATSFMSEPTKIYNEVARGIYDMTGARTGEERARAGRHLVRTAFALTLSFAANAVAQSLSDAWRDDDRDKGYLEKLGEKWQENFWNNFNPIGYVPYLRDVQSIVQGYEVTRMDTEVLADLVSAASQLARARDGEGKKTEAYAGLEVGLQILRAGGLGLANVKRDLLGLVNTALTELGDYETAYELDKLMWSQDNDVGRFVADLYRAMEGDWEDYEAIYQDMVDSGVDPERIASGMEDRMKEELGVKSVASLPVRYSPPGEDEAFDSFMREAADSEDGWTAALPEGSAEAARTADVLGVSLEDYLELTGEGMELEAIQDTLQALDALEPEDDMDRVSKLQQYTAIADLPMAEADKESALALVMSDSAYEKYQSARSAGVSTEDYVWFLSATDGLEADKDENGKSISGSLKAKVLRVIDRMDLNRSQKDALFLAAGYSESTLGDAPWR